MIRYPRACWRTKIQRRDKISTQVCLLSTFLRENTQWMSTGITKKFQNSHVTSCECKKSVSMLKWLETFSQVNVSQDRLSPHILGTFNMVLYLAHVDCSVVSQNMLWLTNSFFYQCSKYVTTHDNFNIVVVLSYVASY